MPKDLILDNSVNDDGIDRRGFLKCMAWAGTGVLWTMTGGVLRSSALGKLVNQSSESSDRDADFSFVQISDSHIGFNKEANTDVVGTLQAAIAKINSLPGVPEFMIHTGDLSHLSKAPEFDTLDQVLKSAAPRDIFFVPGEHDVIGDNGRQYLDRYGKGTRGNGWRSFDHKGTHFVGLVNVMDLKPGGMGSLGQEQLEWLEDDLRGRSNSTPIVVFAHVPLWSVYPAWGWGTDDAEQALGYLKRFGSVAVLNGHIHQTLQKIEGNVTFHTAMSTAFPQPAPGTAPGPGPMKVPAERLRSVLGLASVNYVEGRHSLAIIDSPLASAAPMQEPGKVERNSSQQPGKNEVIIDNFTFTPKTLTVSVGTTVTWINHDDVPHTVVSTDKIFSSPPLDTDQKYSRRFTDAGVFEYYCSIHSHMTGTVIVR